MKTIETSVIPAEFKADTQAVLDHLMSGQPLDPETARRLRDRGDHLREELLKQHGLLDIGVPAIRELRDA